MKFPWSKKAENLDALTEAELQAGVAKCDKTLAKQKHLGDVVAHASILATALGMVGILIACGWIITPMATFGGLGIGVGTFLGTGYSFKAVMTKALRQRNALTDVLEEKIVTRLNNEAESERLRNLEAADKFNAAVNNGLPLEAAIVVKKSLRLKFPVDNRTGFARVVGKMFDPVP